MNNEWLVTTGQVSNNELRPFSFTGRVDADGGRVQLGLTLRWGSPQLRCRGIERVSVFLELGPRAGSLHAECAHTGEDAPRHLVDAALTAADVKLLINCDQTDVLPKLLPFGRDVLMCIVAADLDAAMHKVRGQLATLRERFKQVAALLGQW